MGNVTFTTPTAKAIGYIKGEALTKIIESLNSKTIDHFTLFHTANNMFGYANNEGVLLDYGVFQALTAAASPAPTIHSIVHDDDYVILNIQKVLDLVNGRTQGPIKGFDFDKFGTNLEVLAYGSQVETVVGYHTVPSSSPYTVALGVPVLTVSADIGEIASVNNVTGLVTFDADAAGANALITYTSITDNLVVQIKRSINDATVDAVMINYNHYQLLGGT